MSVYVDKLSCVHTFTVCVSVSLSRPIKSGIGGQKKTFEELLEEQLRLEEQRLRSARQQQVREYNEGLLRNRKSKSLVSMKTRWTVFLKAGD